jgi:hypothetical protein
VGLADSVPWATPVPETGMFRLGLAPLEVMLTLPLMAPAEVGANRTEKEVLWPAVRVSGNASPLMLTPLPVADAAEIVRLEPPELVRVSVRVFVLPTTTFPKARLVGFGVICPAATPVAESAMLRGEFDASETMATFPLTTPAAVGANLTLNVTV